MARETISITPGTGADVVVDTVAGEGGYQVVKLDVGGDGLSSPVTSLATETTLAAILTELGQKYEGGAIALDSATLAALETVSVTGVATETTLAAILTELGQKLEPGGQVALDAATLAALETVQVGSSALPTGAATETTLAAIKTAVELIDNMISGAEAQVDVVTVPADPFGTNADAAVGAGAQGSIQAKLRRLTTDIDAIKTSVAAATPAGNNNIGDVDIASALPAGTNTIGGTIASTGDAYYNGTTSLTVKRAFANIAASTTDGSVIAAVTSKKLRVLAAYVVAGGTATDVTFNSKPAGAGSAISATIAGGANSGAVLPYTPLGWLETVAGEGLTVTTGAGSTVGVQVLYVEV